MDFQPAVIITGASAGIGAATARLLAAAGAAVVMVARSEQRLRDLADKIVARGGTARVQVADVSRAKACRGIVATTVERFGRLDAIINNAGIVEPLALVADTDPQLWQKNLAVNLMGPFYLCHWALSELRRRQGRIINVSSGAAQLPFASMSAYCSSKAGLTHLTAVLAAEEPRVVSIALRPGVVDTPMQQTLRRQTTQTMSSEQIDYYRRLKADAQLESPRVPARAIAWLALQAPHHLSGRFMSYDDDEIAIPAQEFFRDH